MGWWFLGCFTHGKRSKKKQNRHRRRHAPLNNKSEQGFSVAAQTATATAITTAAAVKKKQEEQQVAKPDIRVAVPVFLPTDNEDVADIVPHLPAAAPPPPQPIAVIETEIIDPSSTVIQPNLSTERQVLESEKEKSPIPCKDALEEHRNSEIEPEEEADKILGCHESSSNSAEATHTSSTGTRLSGSSCGYYEISGSCLLRTDIDDDDGCEPSTSLTSHSNNDDNKATSSFFSSGTDGTLESSQISEHSSPKEDLILSLQEGSEASSSSSSTHDECTADSQESRCSVRPPGHRYQGFEEEDSDYENKQGGSSSIIAYTCLDRFDEEEEEDEDAFSDAISTAAFASNIQEEEEVDISSSLVQSSSPPTQMRKQRSVPASPVLTPVENLSQWKRVKQNEGWKSAAIEHLRHRASLLELQARITEEENEQQENRKPGIGQGSIPDTAIALKKANVRTAPDASLSHWVKP